MPADTVTIAGHRCERGSEASRYLGAARMANEVSKVYAEGGRPDAAERFAALVAKNIDCATRAPGYLGPVVVEDAR